MSTKRIMLFLQDLKIGGAQRVMVNLVNGFAARGYDVSLVLVTAEGEFKSAVAERVTVVDLQSRRTVTSLPALVGCLREEQPDVVISALTHTNVMALLALRVAGVSAEVVVTEHGHLGDRLIYSTNHHKESIVLKLAQYLYPWSDHIVANSDAVADSIIQALDLPRKRINVLPNPAVTEEIIEQEGGDVSPEVVPERTGPLITSVGRLVPAKDHLTLVRAFAHIREKTDAHLLILGEGPERGKIEALVRDLNIEKHVSVPGSVGNPFPYLRSSSVFVLSSVTEGFGNALVEAMACGCPVVATDCSSGPREILADGKYGPLVPVGDAEALADAIEVTLKDPIEREQLRERASAYTVERLLDKYERMLSTTLSSE